MGRKNDIVQVRGAGRSVAGNGNYTAIGGYCGHIRINAGNSTPTNPLGSFPSWGFRAVTCKYLRARVDGKLSSLGTSFLSR